MSQYPNIPLEPNYQNAAMLWWALFWRSVTLALLASFAVGFVIGLIAGFLHLGDSLSLRNLSFFAGAAIGISMCIFVTRHLMTKGFGPYKILIVEK